jgi:hypothetical protein
MKKVVGRRGVERGLVQDSAKSAGKVKARRQERSGENLDTARGQTRGDRDLLLELDPPATRDPMVSRGPIGPADLQSLVDFRSRVGLQSPEDFRDQVDSPSNADFRSQVDFRKPASRAAAKAGAVRGLAESGRVGGKSRSAQLNG